MTTRHFLLRASGAGILAAVASFATPLGGATAQPSRISDSAAHTKERPVPNLVGLPLAKAERVIAAWGFESYGTGQEPAPGRSGLVIWQGPAAGRTAVPATTNFYLTEGVSYQVTAHLQVATCLGDGPGVGSPNEVEVGPYPQVRTVAEDFASGSAGAWRVFGIPALVAPEQWRCTGFVAEDGGNVFTAVPPGEVPPSPTRDEASGPSPRPEIAVAVRLGRIRRRSAGGELLVITPRGPGPGLGQPAQSYRVRPCAEG